jgi:1-acyl-sn-glycerol-3-phosphate acyltransferase
MLPGSGRLRLALDAGIPIVPIAVEGSADILGRRGWQVRSGTIDVVVGAPSGWNRTPRTG